MLVSHWHVCLGGGVSGHKIIYNKASNHGGTLINTSGRRSLVVPGLQFCVMAPCCCLYTAVLLLLLLLPAAQGGFACGSLQIGVCLRAGTLTSLRVFPRTAQESASAAACCAACAAALPNCTAWQLGQPASLAMSPDCTLLREAIVVSSSTRVCNSSVMVPAERIGRTALSGVWMQHGDLRTLSARGFLIGADLVIKWATVEPSDGVFDWTSVTQELAQADGAEFYMQAALQTGPDAPAWIYARAPPVASVPLVNVTPDPGHEETIFPFYLDGTYQALFLRAQRAFADYLARLPPRLRRRIISGQAMYGSTGDDIPWHGRPLNSSFAISQAQWNNFTHSLAPALCSTFAGNATTARLQLLWNGDAETDLDFFLAVCPGSLIKTGSASHGYQINFELEDYATKGALCHAEGVNCRGEEWPFSNTGGYLEAPTWGEYWHLLALLWFGTDRPGLSQPALDDPANLLAYTMFNRYAGSIRPPAGAWAGAIIALRDGLDAADTVRFPEALFGGALQTNTTRNAAIAAAFAARGAAQGDAVAATRPPLGSRSPTSLNDVGWRVSSGNWGNGLAVQLAPNETSIGWWRVGPRAAPYGRFARGFHHASGRDAMSFVLDARLWGGLPLPVARGVALTLRLVYFDAGGGVLSLAYDAASGCAAAAVVPVAAAAVVLIPWAKAPAAGAPTAPGAWAEITLNITDGYFGRRCGPHGADIVLSSTADTIVHGFEIYRTSSGGASATYTLTQTPAPKPSPSSTPALSASVSPTVPGTPSPTGSRTATPSLPGTGTPSLTPTQSASQGALGILGVGGMAATSGSAENPGLLVIVVPSVVVCVLFVAALFILLQRRAAHRLALLSAPPPGSVHVSAVWPRAMGAHGDRSRSALGNRSRVGVLLPPPQGSLFIEPTYR
jgi:hypothetical protein